MKPLKEVCVGRRCCYDKEIPWHQWVASPALGYGPPRHTLTGRGVVPSGQPLVLWVTLAYFSIPTFLGGMVIAVCAFALLPTKILCPSEICPCQCHS